MKRVIIFFLVVFLFSNPVLAEEKKEEVGLFAEVRELLLLTKNDGDVSHIEKALQLCKDEENKITIVIKGLVDAKKDMIEDIAGDPYDPRLDHLIPQLNNDINNLNGELSKVKELRLLAEDIITALSSVNNLQKDRVTKRIYAFRVTRSFLNYQKIYGKIKKK